MKFYRFDLTTPTANSSYGTVVTQQILFQLSREMMRQTVLDLISSGLADEFSFYRFRDGHMVFFCTDKAAAEIKKMSHIKSGRALTPEEIITLSRTVSPRKTPAP